jgi:hypothetical protein
LIWYKKRTKKDYKKEELTSENTLVMQLVFELVHGERIETFARKFQRRLSHLGIDKKAKTIIAANSLYLDAPIKLLEDEKERDALQRLCEEDQLHFRLVKDETNSLVGIRLAHAHLSWLLLREWIDSSITSFERQWARELHKVLESHLHSNNWVLAGNLIWQLILSHKMGEGTGKELPDRHTVILELYCLHVVFHDSNLPLIILPRWLDLIYKIPSLSLTPDPFQIAVEKIQDGSCAKKMHGSIVRWVWMIANRKSPKSVKQIHEAVEKYFFQYPENEGVGQALQKLINHNIENNQLVGWIKHWLSKNCHLECAFYLLVFVDHRKINNNDFVKQIRQWLEFNWKHTWSYRLISTLITAKAKDDSTVVDLAKKWLEDNDEHPQAYWLITSLITAKAKDDSTVVDLAKKWLKDNEEHPQAYCLIAPLVTAKAKDDSTVVNLAKKWLEDNDEHPQAYQVIAPLVTAKAKNDSTVVDLAKKWLEDNGCHPQRHHVIVTLVASIAKEDEQVLQIATSWLNKHWETNKVQEVLFPLVATGLTSTTGLIVKWLKENEKHPHHNNILCHLLYNTNQLDDIIDLSEIYLKTSSSMESLKIHGALIAHNQGKAIYIDRFQNFIDTHESRELDIEAKQHLGNNLVHHPHGLSLYLQDKKYPHRHKVRSCICSAHAVKRFPELTEEFFNCLQQVYPNLSVIIFKIVLTQEIDPVSKEIFNKAIVKWIKANYRSFKKEYKLLLNAIGKHSENCKLEEFSNVLPAQIIREYQQLKIEDQNKKKTATNKKSNKNFDMANTKSQKGILADALKKAMDKQAEKIAEQ